MVQKFFKYAPEGKPEIEAVDPSQIDHNSLSNLLVGDAHTQYHNDTRGDIRYYTKAEVDAFVANALSLTGMSYSILDVNLEIPQKRQLIVSQELELGAGIELTLSGELIILN